jgi:hypothetical protein
MRNTLKDIRLRIAKLEKEAKELKRLKTDCNDARRFREKLIEAKFD